MKAVLVDQLGDDAPLVAMLREGLDGLTDAEYLWEPVPYCWSVRPRREQRTAPDRYHPEGDWGVDIEYPDPSPSPFTTIAWRLTHLTGSTYVAAAALRGDRLPSGHLDERWPQDSAVATTAADAVARWESALNELRTRLDAASEDDLLRTESHEWDWPPPPEPGAGDAVWKQVLFFACFEPASHAAEVRLLRDLYRHTDGGRRPLVPA